MRVLLIEDDERTGNILKEGLQAECFEVDIARDGEAGSFLARTNHYDVIVLDSMLPNKEGGDVCREIRAHGKSTPIIVLSARTDIASKVALLNAGADDYLTKPFSFEELLARLKAILRRPMQVAEEILALDDLRLDIKRQTACRGRKQIYLTRKEFMLLEYLLKNKGAVLSRGMIMEHVWDMDVNPFSNTIESHIVSLRKKIDMHGKRKLIHTIPGRGYAIDVR